MRKLIDYINSLFCQHEYECIKQVQVYDVDYPRHSSNPIGTKWVYRCKKCCYHKIVKDY